MVIVYINGKYNEVREEMYFHKLLRSLLPNECIHREDGPAEIWPDGRQEYWINGQRHREDGPAVIDSNGYKAWWVRGRIHRLKGPAIIHPNGTKEWVFKGKHHRLDGPAVFRPGGSKEYWINGNRIKYEDWLRIIKWLK